MSDRLLDCRSAAALCLAKVHKGNSLNQQLPAFESKVKDRDRPLLKQLCYGVLRFYPRLLAISDQLIQKPLKPKDNDILMLILLGGYQLTDTRIPAHAAVSATVAATRNLKKTWAKALVNGVLRQWQRNNEELMKSLSRAQMFAHPDWLHQVIETAWEKQAESIQLQNNQHPPMCLRINRQITSREKYLQQLRASDLDAKSCEYSNSAIQLLQAVPVDNLPGFEQGQVSVQDEAAQLAAQLLSVEPGQRVLDACSAPGGKTCHIIETQPGISEVVALDINDDRLLKVSQNLTRLKLTATVVSGDAKQLDSWWDKRLFDRILLDAPCSGTGVIRRNPDIKLHRQASDIQQLAHLQMQLLTALWSTLKPGGLLLYATCSIIPAENENLIAQFCLSQKLAEHRPISATWGVQRPFGRQLFPQQDGHDGFYYALLHKKALTV